MNTKTFAKIALGAMILTPFFAYAATVMTILTQIRDILNAVIPILMVLATVVFLWGIILYVVAGSDEEKVERAKGFIITGLVGLFVMIAIWGIVQAIVSQFGLANESVTIPPGPKGQF